MQRTILVIVLTAFLALTALALYFDGLIAIFEPLWTRWAGAQLVIDLVIALSLWLVWMWKDAKAAGRSPWLWVILTFGTGSIAPLIYLLLYKTKV